MKCHECDYYSENNGYYGEWNGCKLLGFEYFHTYYEDDCPYIDDNYNLTKDGLEAREIL